MQCVNTWRNGIDSHWRTKLTTRVSCPTLWPDGQRDVSENVGLHDGSLIVLFKTFVVTKPCGWQVSLRGATFIWDAGYGMHEHAQDGNANMSRRSEKVETSPGPVQKAQTEHMHTSPISREPPAKSWAERMEEEDPLEGCSMGVSELEPEGGVKDDHDEKGIWLSQCRTGQSPFCVRFLPPLAEHNEATTQRPF